MNTAAVAPSAKGIKTSCIDWHEAVSHLTETICVRGIVAGTFTDARRGADYPSFFVYFDPSSQLAYGFTVGFYADSVLKWEELLGQCVEFSGYIEPNRYGPLMHILRPDQLSYCEPETANLTPTVIGILATPSRLMPSVTLSPTTTPNSIQAGPPTCSLGVGGSFTRIWNEPALYSRLVCPSESEFRGESAVENFEGGFMLWRGNSDRVYAIYNAGTWDVFPKEPADIFQEGKDPECSCGPHASRPSPRRGFSKIWCNNPDVPTTLGNAVNYEEGFCMGNPCDSFQDFQGGTMYRSVKLGGIYVLFADGTWLKR